MAVRKGQDAVKMRGEDDLLNEVEALRAALAIPETEHTWEKIDRAVKRFTTALTSGGTEYSDGIVRFMRDPDVIRAIQTALATERTQLSGATVIMLEAASSIGTAFVPLINIYFPALVKLLLRTNKLYVSRATSCILAIIRNTHSPAVIPYLKEGIDEKAVTMRKASVTAFQAILGVSDSHFAIDKDALERRYMGDIEYVIKKGVIDKDIEVRSMSKKLWDAYKLHWHDRVADFTDPLTPITKRYLDLGPTKSSKPPLPKPPTASTSRPAPPKPRPAPIPVTKAAAIPLPPSPKPAPKPSRPLPPSAKPVLSRSTGPSASRPEPSTSRAAEAPSNPPTRARVVSANQAEEPRKPSRAVHAPTKEALLMQTARDVFKPSTATAFTRTEKMTAHSRPGHERTHSKPGRVVVPAAPAISEPPKHSRTASTSSTAKDAHPPRPDSAASHLSAGEARRNPLSASAPPAPPNVPAPIAKARVASATNAFKPSRSRAVAAAKGAPPPPRRQAATLSSSTGPSRPTKSSQAKEDLANKVQPSQATMARRERLAKQLEENLEQKAVEATSQPEVPFDAIETPQQEIAPVESAQSSAPPTVENSPTIEEEPVMQDLPVEEPPVESTPAAATVPAIEAALIIPLPPSPIISPQSTAESAKSIERDAAPLTARKGVSLFELPPSAKKSAPSLLDESVVLQIESIPFTNSLSQSTRVLPLSLSGITHSENQLGNTSMEVNPGAALNIDDLLYELGFDASRPNSPSAIGSYLPSLGASVSSAPPDPTKTPNWWPRKNNAVDTDSSDQVSVVVRDDPQTPTTKQIWKAEASKELLHD